MHLSTYNVPRIISCADVSDDWLGLPRGCEDALVGFFEENSVGIKIEDKTNHGHAIDVSFSGTLRPEQEAAVSQLMSYDNGILSGTTAFGKTVAAIGLIARRKVNTLILVHNKALAKQWQTKFCEFMTINYTLPEAPKKRGAKEGTAARRTAEFRRKYAERQYRHCSSTILCF
jgi:superfamily II DNA or RNA helicase